MRTHRVEEVKVLELALYLNVAIAEGREIASILDGTTTRSNYVLVVSYKDDPPTSFVHEHKPPFVPPQSDAPLPPTKKGSRRGHTPPR